MIMLELWQKRLRRHQGQQFKYLRLVFNDHFVIALIFLLGALALGYANLLKLVTQTYWWSPFLLGALYTFFLSVGHLATLFEEADSTFLLPKESELFHYLVAARKYSLLVPTLILILVGIALFPLGMVIDNHFSMVSAVFVVLATIVLKDFQLWVTFLDCYDANVVSATKAKSYFYGFSFLILVIGLYTSTIVSFVLALLANIWLRRQITTRVLDGDLQFQNVIELENIRQFKILKIYNLFTDIPSLQRQAKRRKYLDWLLKPLPKSHQQSYLYLFSRGFLRGTEYLGFYVRFLLIGTLILCFVKQLWLAGVLYVLFLYLSGFQLLPFYDQYDSIVFTRLYPVSDHDKLQAFQRFLSLTLGLQWLITSIPLLINFKASLKAIGMVALGLVVFLAFVFGYTKLRLTKNRA